MKKHGSKYFLPADPPPPTVEMGSIDKMSTFSEHGHIAYQIKWDHEIQQHGSKLFWPHTSPSPYDPRGVGSKGQNSNFSEHGHVAYKTKR